MPRALPVPVRQVMARRWQRGQAVPDIAASLGLAPRTVRHWLALFRARGVEAATLQPGYARSGWHRDWPNQLLVEAALHLRQEHPGWGAGLVRVFLQEQWRRQHLPSVRTLQRWFRRAGLAPAPRGRPPPTPRGHANRPHEIWQMDAVERLPLKDGRRVCWLRISDEFSGSILHTKVFDRPRWSQVGSRAVQGELRHAFRRWGRPQCLRVDNGTPWGANGGLPTPLALWLLGLPVQVIWNRPRRPQQNAVVERSQGVSQRWAEPSTCSDMHELQRRLDRMDRIQRDKYPSIHGRTRRQSFPGLAHRAHCYSPAWEKRHWRLERVLDRLTEYAVARRVDACGKVWLYDRSYMVGKRHRGKTVYVTMDLDRCQWVFQDADARELARQPARELTRQLTRQRVMRLEVGRTACQKTSHGKTLRRPARQNYVSHLAAKLTVA